MPETLTETFARFAEDAEFRRWNEGRKPESRFVYDEPLGRARRIIIRACLRGFASRGFSLLDVGCNLGHYCLYYATIGGLAHGIDISVSLVSAAEERATEMGLRGASFEVANAESFSGGPYDVVLCSEVLEHFRHPERALASFGRCLRPM